MAGREARGCRAGGAGGMKRPASSRGVRRAALFAGIVSRMGLVKKVVR